MSKGMSKADAIKFAAAKKRIDAWNACHEVGERVAYYDGHGNEKIGETTSAARLCPEYWCGVDVDGKLVDLALVGTTCVWFDGKDTRSKDAPPPREFGLDGEALTKLVAAWARRKLKGTKADLHVEFRGGDGLVSASVVVDR